MTDQEREKVQHLSEDLEEAVLQWCNRNAKWRWAGEPVGQPHPAANPLYREAMRARTRMFEVIAALGEVVVEIGQPVAWEEGLGLVPIQVPVEMAAPR